MNPSSPSDRRFVQIADAIRETNPWTNNEWLCRPDVVAAEKLLLVRANMAPGWCHPFHFHPHREEIIHVVYGRAEQWVGDKYRILGPGEIAHIPPGVIHGTFNPFAEPLVFLAILSPAVLPDDLAKDPDPHDVGTVEPWASFRKQRGLKPCIWGDNQTA
jgi:quercetin dioxygenase-like cupin family protein